DSPIPNTQYPILRANLTLLALQIPPGDLAFDLVYWPDSLRWGLAITGGALLILGVGFFYRRADW
ncbi:MAG: hypothetical protein HY328_14770, partial [Chloroflexi bacterium]|nr:hypothetical protein [Chloroflexota bacterium]